MPLYDYPNSTNLVGLFQSANDYTGGVFGYLLILVIWVLFFMLLKAYPTGRAFATASFLTTLVSFFLIAAEIAPHGALILTIVMTVISIFLIEGEQS